MTALRQPEYVGAANCHAHRVRACDEALPEMAAWHQSKCVDDADGLPACWGIGPKQAL